jgi:hypothetical protein
MASPRQRPSANHCLLCRVWLQCGAALVIGFLGNTKVDDGMRGSVDATLYEMKNLLKVANSAMSQMNAIMATAPGDAAVSST